MVNSGTVSRGVKAPIIKKGDNIVNIVCDSISQVVETDNVVLQDKDVVCVTEAIVARAQGNYASIDAIAKDIATKFEGSETVGLVFPILSRNRFSILLKAISKGVKKLVIQLSFPSDEVGNKIVSLEEVYASGVNPYTDSFTSAEFKNIFKNTVHEFTGVDYIDFYKSLAPNAEIILSSNPKAILEYTNDVIVASIHDRFRNKKTLLDNGANKVFMLDEILTESVDGSGCHEQYGLLGSNLSTDDTVKLFPRDCQTIVEAIQAELKNRFNKHIEVMVYGDGAFKDPQGGIWELADPVVSPGFTSGLVGTPNELKLKFLADSTLKDYEGEELKEKMKELIRTKDENLVGQDVTLGTTPRQLTDLLGSLADLTSGSGDKGTPIILIQNYFTNYASE